MDEKTLDEAAKVFTVVAGTGNMYQDSMQPVAKQIGRSLETVGGVINMALGPVALMVQGYELIHEKLKRKLEEKLGETAKDQIIEPPLPIVGPLLEKYRFVHDQPELAELFENLLATAMDERTVRRAHPAFVHIVSQLSPDEAKLLQAISEDPFVIPKVDLFISFNDGTPGELRVMANLTNLDQRAGVDSGLTRAYMDNLVRLGIIEVDSGSPLAQSDLYLPLMKHPELKRVQATAAKAQLSVSVIKGKIKTTEFGHMFIQSVLRKRKD
jgi:hypothetical protein